jgi:hypothetical protein
MKQCPQCNGVYPDEGLKFCGRDGSPLVDLSQAAGGFPSLPVSPAKLCSCTANSLPARLTAWQ